MSDPYKHLAWDDFRLVMTVAAERSLPAAAARLGLNHSTVFRRLAAIEAALGRPLFERLRTGYVPTPAGEAMAAVGVRLDDDVTAFTRQISGQEIAPAGELRVTTSDILLAHLLTPVFARFQRGCTDIQLDIVVANDALNLSKRDADVAIRASDRPPETLVGRRVGRLAWALYAREGDDPIDPDTARWVGFGDALASLKAAKATHAAARGRVVYRLSTVLGLAEAVEAGVGIGYLPCFLADRRPGLTRLQAPRDHVADDLWLLTHPDLRHQPRVRVFLDFMAAALVSLRPLLEGRGGCADPERGIGCHRTTVLGG